MTSAPPTTRTPSASTVALAVLSLGTVILSAVMVHRGSSTLLEAISVISGALCVWLAARENVWNFPVGMIGSVTFTVVFFRAGLFADGVLQVIYLVLGVIGWYLWLFGGARNTALVVTLAPQRRRLAVGLAIIVMWAVQWYVLVRTGDSAPFWDALTTAISLGAQWLLDRKNIENWILWIIVDVIYIPLYLSKELYLTAALYAVFVCMAVIGLLHWRKLLLESHAPRNANPPETRSRPVETAL